MGEWVRYKLKDFLEQYRETLFVNDDTIYGQITISKFSGVSFREQKSGKEIGRKRQFYINLKKYPHTLLFTRQGVAEGSIGLAPKEVDGCIATENMPMFSINTTMILPEILNYLIKSPVFKNKVNSLTPVGSAQKAIHERDLLELEFIFPKDLTEQMELCNSLNFKFNEINKLFSNIEEDIINLNLLRQSILQEAIEGKLTADWSKQNPVRKGDPNTDAAALLDKIKLEKEKMIAEGKIKREKPLEPIKPEEIPFELPEGWVWCRLGDILKHYVDCPHVTPKYLENGKICLRASNITPSGIIFNEKRFISESEYQLRIERLKPEKFDLVYIREGGRLGIAGLINIDEPCCLGQRLMLMRFFDNITAFYACYYINSPKTYQEAMNISLGSASPHINVRDVIRHLFPLPPFAEQKAIIELVGRLLTMVNEMEQQVNERKNQAEELMQAVLRDSFERRVI